MGRIERILWRSRVGMTLPELMVVIAIIALLVYLAWTWLRTYIEDAKESEAKEMVKKICEDLLIQTENSPFFPTPWVPNDTPGRVKQLAGDGMQELALSGGSNLLQGRALQCSYKVDVKEVVADGTTQQEILVVAVCDANGDQKYHLFAAGGRGGNCYHPSDEKEGVSRSEHCASFDVGMVQNAIKTADAAFALESESYLSLKRSLGRCSP